MRSVITGLFLLGSVAAAPSTFAQTANGGGNAPGDNPGRPGASAGQMMDRNLGTNVSGTNPNGSRTGQAAAGGNDNQAVATTAANAAQPAHGANSFTRGEARRRMAARGFHKVSGLRKDNHGVWRGTATRDGTPVQVWLDYKGNVGQASDAAQ